MFGHHQSAGQELVSLNWIVEEAIGMLSRLVEEDIEIRVSLGKDVALVRVDPGQMEQVLLNLVVNARDAMPNVGELVIETQLVNLNEDFALQHTGIAPGEHVLLRSPTLGTEYVLKNSREYLSPSTARNPKTKAPGSGSQSSNPSCKKTEA
jgi:two-component system, cell cycle sensor histidine kinase and response regulator CckA